MARRLHRLGRWCVTHRWAVLGIWLALLVGLTAMAARFGGEPEDEFRVPGVESQAARDLLEERFPQAAGGSAQLVFHVDEGAITDGDRPAVVTAVVDEVAAVPGVGSVSDPALAPSPDGSTQLAQVQYDVALFDLGPEDLEALVRGHGPG